MKEDVKDKWIAELRSGKHQQGKGTMKRGDRLCCLAVLQGPVLGLPVREETEYFLSEEARVAAGIDTATGGFSNDPHNWTLANYNDNGTDFAGIADIIERQWPHL